MGSDNGQDILMGLNAFWKASLTFLFAATLSSFAHAQFIPSLNWQSKHGSDNSLVGRLFDGKGSPATWQEMVAQAANAQFVLLGEIHDNPDHHQIQATILQELIDAGRRPTLVWEMVPKRLADEANSYDLITDPKLQDYARRLEWEERGWYTWEIYRPIALVAARAGLKMTAGNLDRSVTRALSKNGIGVLTPEQQADFALRHALPVEIQKQLYVDLQQSHCNLMPERALPAMANVQRARDGAMANAILQSGKGDHEDGAVLIAGNGHVRKDRAVPFVLGYTIPGTSKSLSVGLVEVSPELLSFDDYQLAVNGTQLYDFVIFTPQYNNSDHCAALRQRFEQTKKKQP
ncbi:MAG: ChaN family lipoprotein [Rhizobiaceae bacterium]|nr:ChaN family lipoprotein [Rhizobiaceae bacterium]